MIRTPTDNSTRGRPSTNQTPVVDFGVTDQLRTAIAQWADQQPDRPALPEAVRRLVELGLNAGPPATPAKTVATRTRETRAKELADKTIDKIGDPGAAPEERAERSRRLTKGPSEFRAARVDLPKRTT